MNHENELVNIILEEIETHKIKSKEELQQEIKMKLYECYQPFLNFAVNKDNFKKSYEKLTNYKYITIEELEAGRFIRYLSNKYFYDIKLMKGGFVSQIDTKKNIITLLNGPKIIKINYEDLWIFMKLNEEDIVKQMILQSL